MDRWLLWLLPWWMIALPTSAYSLVDPVPQEHLREMVTERPDQPESPYTVDAGHLMLELDALVLRAPRDFSALPEADLLRANVRVGLSDGVDLHLILPALVLEPGADAKGVNASADATTLRVKWNLVGNDGGAFGLGLMPYVTVPAAGASADVDAGLLVPANFELFGDLALGLMLDLAGVSLASAPDLRSGLSAALGHPLLWGFSGYADGAVNLRPLKLAESQVVVGTGLTWLATPDLQLDTGLRVDLLAPAPVLEVFTGVALRR